MPIHTLGEIDGGLIGLVAVVSASTVALVGILAGARASSVRARQQEESRREIAAYVAEGTISPDDAAKLIAAGDSAAGAKA